MRRGNSSGLLEKLDSYRRKNNLPDTITPLELMQRVLKEKAVEAKKVDKAVDTEKHFKHLFQFTLSLLKNVPRPKTNFQQNDQSFSQSTLRLTSSLDSLDAVQDPGNSEIYDHDVINKRYYSRFKCAAKEFQEYISLLSIENFVNYVNVHLPSEWHAESHDTLKELSTVALIMFLEVCGKWQVDYQTALDAFKKTKDIYKTYNDYFEKNNHLFIASDKGHIFKK